MVSFPDTTARSPCFYIDNMTYFLEGDYVIMKLWSNIVKVIISILGVVVVAFNGLLYIAFEKQKTQIESINSQQQVESQVENNKFKYQQGQIEHLNQDLDAVQQQFREQKVALADQKDEDKNIQTSLVDIKAEADAIKQDMKKWQKDYVSVLAQLEKKMDDSQNEIKGVKDDLDSFEKIIQSPDNSSMGPK